MFLRRETIAINTYNLSLFRDIDRSPNSGKIPKLKNTNETRKTHCLWIAFLLY